MPVEKPKITPPSFELWLRNRPNEESHHFRVILSKKHRGKQQNHLTQRTYPIPRAPFKTQFHVILKKKQNQQEKNPEQQASEQAEYKQYLQKHTPTGLSLEEWLGPVIN